MNKLGFIGCGKMASAIIKGVLNHTNGNFEIIGSEINEDVAKTASERLGIKVICDNKILAQQSDVIILATKPNCVLPVLEEIKPFLNNSKLVIA